MNSNVLKLTAVVAMVLDHVAWILFPSMEIFHFIGKIAFPIFCFMIAEGYLKTHDKKKYLFRLTLIAVISEIPFLITFRLAFGQNFRGLDTIFDLVLGLVAIWFYDVHKFKGRTLVVFLIGIVALFIGVDGDLFGVLAIFLFYKYHGDFKEIAKKYLLMSIIYNLSIIGFQIVQSILIGVPISQITFVLSNVQYWISFLEEVGGISLALIPIKFYNGEKGRSMKYFFYGFYPVHLIILYGINMLTSK